MCKKVNFKVLVLLMVSVLLLASCNDNVKGTESKGDAVSEQASSLESSVVTEESSEAVSEDEQSAMESSEDISEDEQSVVESSEVVSEDEQSVTESSEVVSEDEQSLEENSAKARIIEPQMKAIKICVPDDEYMNFEYKEMEFDGTIDGIIGLLAGEKLFSEDVKANSIEIEGDTVRIDFSEEFGFAISTGTCAERMIVGSLVNTLISAYDVEQVYFTVEGHYFESGHVYYDFPLTFVANLD